MLTKDVKRIIENIVIKYRKNFKTKQDPKKIFSVAMSSDAKSELLQNIKESMKEIKLIVDDINLWSDDKIEKEFKERGLEEKKVKRKKILVFPKLKNVVDGKVVTTFAPEPSKYPHIGHAITCLINYKFAKMYSGKFYLRFEDTNPNLAKEEYYKAQLDGINWLGIKPDKIIYASDYMDLIYEKSEFLIKNKSAYVCDCDSKTVRNLREKRLECKCRSNSVDKNLELWKKMLLGKFETGEVSLRLMGDMKSHRAEFRDPVLMRINKAKHPRVGNKYFVWPTYLMQNTILDCVTGVTHRFRSKEFEVWHVVQIYLAKKLGYEYPEVFEYARVNLVGGQASGRKLREQVIEGNLSWDDPSLTSLVALKRRGFLPEAIIEFVEKIGVSKTESTVEWSVLESINRKYFASKNLNKIASFENPVKVKVLDENKVLEKDLNEVYIDANTEFNKEYKLRHVGNVIRKNNSLIAVGNEQKKGLNMLPFAQNIFEVKVLMPSLKNKETKLYVDADLYKTLKTGDVVYLERFAYCRLDSKEKNTFVFTHK